MDATLSIEELSVGFVHRGAAIQAVDAVSLRVAPSECIGIVGESGCGKSTLARLLMHLIPRDAGELIFDGEGHMVGILHSGMLKDGSNHVTYATPAWWDQATHGRVSAH